MKRRWLLWLLIIVAVWIVVSRFAEIKNLAQTLGQGEWGWVLAAAFLQAIYYVVYAALYQSAFDTVGIKSRVSQLLPVMFASLIVNVTAPVAGLGGAVLFVDDVAQRGQSATQAAAGAILVLVADFVTFTLVLIVGLTYLFLQHNLQAYQVIGAAVVLLVAGSLIGVLLLGLRGTGRLRRVLGWVQRVVNRIGGWFRRPSLLTSDWAEKNTVEFTKAAAAIAAHPRRLARTLAVALTTRLVHLASLFALFLAFYRPVGLGDLVAGYAVGFTFWIVSITPQGIGVVEGVMALVFTSLGVPPAEATTIALAFRGLGLWLPLAVGFFLLRRVRSFGHTSNV